MNLMVIVPTYDEAANLPVLVPQLFETADMRVLVVDDNSPDGTGQVAEELAATYAPLVQVLHRIGRRRGLGASYIDGLCVALEEGADMAIGMDADLSHDPAHIPRMLRLASQYDLIIGSRL